MITFEIDKNNLEKLLKKLTVIQRDETIMPALKLGALNIERWIVSRRLSGPRPQYLGVITNRLRGSISTGDVERLSDGYQVKIGTNVKYAPIHEFGGTINMPARSSKINFRTFKRGKNAGRTLFSKAKKATSFGTFSIPGYSIKIPARPFMRPGIEDKGNQSFVLQKIKDGIEKAVAAI